MDLENKLEDPEFLAHLVPVNAPELHERCLLARWSKVCAKYDALVDLNPSSVETQARRNLMEMASHLLGKVFTLEAIRGNNPGHHRPEDGISEDGQMEIFHATVDYHNAVYMVLGNAANVVNRHRNAFMNPGSSSVTKFLLWLATHDQFKFAVNNSIRPSKAFRTIVNHPHDHYTYNWETQTNGGSSIYVLLKGLNSTREDTPTDRNFYIEGQGWHLPSPEECLTTIFILDIIDWVFDGVEHSIKGKGAISDQGWYKRKDSAFEMYLRDNIDAIAFEFRRAVPTEFDQELFDRVSVFD